MNSSMMEFIRCRDPEHLQEIRQLLDSAKIAYQIGPDFQVFDLATLRSESQEGMTVKISTNDYDAARRALEDAALMRNLPPGHYLLNSTDDELEEVVANASEWSAHDVAHARRLLNKRGIDPKRIEQKRQAKLQELRAGKRASTTMLCFGWLFTILGGLVGVGIAWSLCYMKKKTPDGEFFEYDEYSRRIGKIMFFVATAVFAGGVCSKVIIQILQ
jgi:hypothetical protein